MAKKSVTYKGKPKPYGKSGHYYESQRHALQAKGIRTGTYVAPMSARFGSQTDIMPPEEKSLIREFAEELTNPLQDTDRDGVPDALDCSPNDPTKQDDEEVFGEIEFNVEPDETMEVEIEPAEIEIKRPSKDFMEKMHEGFEGFMEGFAKEKEVKKERLKQRVAKELEREEIPEVREREFVTKSEKFGKIVADIFGDYTSEDLAELSNSELEDLAVKFESAEGGILGKPPNLFKDELIKRIKAEEKLNLEKAKARAELEPLRKNIQAEIQQIKTRSTEKDGILEDIREFCGGKR